MSDFSAEVRRSPTIAHDRSKCSILGHFLSPRRRQQFRRCCDNSSVPLAMFACLLPQRQEEKIPMANTKSLQYPTLERLARQLADSSDDAVTYFQPHDVN